MLSLPHLIVVFIIALVIFGPEKLPELARILGKATGEFRRMTSDFRFALEQEVRDLDRQVRIHEEERKAAESQIPPNYPLATPREVAAAAEPKPPVTSTGTSTGTPTGAEPVATTPASATAREPEPANSIAPPRENKPEDHAA